MAKVKRKAKVPARGGTAMKAKGYVIVTVWFTRKQKKLAEDRARAAQMKLAAFVRAMTLGDIAAHFGDGEPEVAISTRQTRAESVKKDSAGVRVGTTRGRKSP